MAKQREITGRTVFFITASAFTVIIGVNLYMATSAVRTFPGLEVANSYVASQQFDRQAAEQSALGWDLRANNEDGKFHISILGPDGKPVFPAKLEVRLGRPTVARDDQIPELRREGDGYVADTDLADGKWYAYVEAANADGVTLQQRLEFYVGGAVPEWDITSDYENGELVTAVTNTVGDPVFPKVFEVQVDRVIDEAAATPADETADTAPEAPDVLQVRRDNQAIVRDAKTLQLRIENGKYYARVALEPGEYYAYIHAVTPEDVELTQRIAFTVPGGDE